MGQPLTLRPWQRDIVTRLFGTLRPNGRRQYRRCYIWIPRKNGKTELAAALALYALLGDNEPGAQIYSAAADRQNAALIFTACANMIRADAELSGYCEIVESLKEIRYRPTGSIYRALSAEAYSKHGLNAHVVIYDELHTAQDRGLWDVLTSSQGARRQPLVIVISTAGFDRTSIGYEIYDYTRKVRDGIIEDAATLPVIYGADEQDDWTDERVWEKANPALGDFREVDELRDAFKVARNLPSEENKFRQLYLNQWTEQATRWLDMATWDAQAGTVNEDALAGRMACGGLDIASVSDLSAVAWAFPEATGDAVTVLVRCWLPEAQLERARNPKRWDVYRRWVDAGLLLVTPGSATDYAFIKAAIIADCQRFDVRRLHVDRLFQGQQLMQELEEQGVPVAAMGQGFMSMGPAVKAFERRYLQGKIRHGANPLLRWAVANAVAVHDPAGNTKLDKSKAQDKIDPLQALVMAIDAVERISTADPVYVW